MIYDKAENNVIMEAEKSQHLQSTGDRESWWCKFQVWRLAGLKLKQRGVSGIDWCPRPTVRTSSLSSHPPGTLTWRPAVIIPQMVASPHWLLSQTHTPKACFFSCYFSTRIGNFAFQTLWGQSLFLTVSVVCVCVHSLFCLPPYYGPLESCLPRATQKHVYLYSITCYFRSQWSLETWLWSFLRSSGLTWALKRENCIGMWCWIPVITLCHWVRDLSLLV